MMGIKCISNPTITPIRDLPATVSRTSNCRRRAMILSVVGLVLLVVVGPGPSNGHSIIMSSGSESRYTVQADDVLLNDVEELQATCER